MVTIRLSRGGAKKQPFYRVCGSLTAVIAATGAILSVSVFSILLRVEMIQNCC